MDITLHINDIPPDLLEFFEPVDPRAQKDVLVLGPEPYSAAHFATYPRALVRPFILAGTSAAGCCASCGKPWVRVVERTPIPDSVRAESEANRQRTADLHGRNDGHVDTHKPNFKRDVLSEDWIPSCQCGAPTVPALVLDPFCGSGTTCAVAQELGRRGVGLDLSAAYIELARQRIFKAAIPLFAAGIEA